YVYLRLDLPVVDQVQHNDQSVQTHHPAWPSAIIYPIDQIKFRSSVIGHIADYWSDKPPHTDPGLPEQTRLTETHDKVAQQAPYAAYKFPSYRSRSSPAPASPDPAHRAA